MSFSNLNIGKKVDNFEVSEIFDAYGRVDIEMGEDEQGNAYTISYPNLPDDQVSGRILTVPMPMCTDTDLARAAAQRIYTSLTTKNDTSFQYVPMNAVGAQIDPSVEFGDSVDINGIHSGFYVRATTFGRLMKADLSSPTDEEIDHEYPYQDVKQRQITRANRDFKSGLYINAEAIKAEVQERTAQGQAFTAELSVHATQIAARVTKTGGNTSSFGWVLNDSSHTWYAGNRAVMKITASGLEVYGKVTATSGDIGGFKIGAYDLKYNDLDYGSANKNYGIYIGQRGIQLGKDFRVDNSGNVTASNLSLKGTLTFLNSDGSWAGTMSAADLRQGAAYANAGNSIWNSTSSRVSSSGGSWDSSYDWTDSNGSYCIGGAGWGYNFGSMDNVDNAFPINASSFRYSGSQLTPQTISFIDGNNNQRTFYGVLMYAQD